MGSRATKRRIGLLVFGVLLTLQGCVWDTAAPPDVVCTQGDLRVLLAELAEGFSAGFCGRDAERVAKSVAALPRSRSKFFEFPNVVFRGRSSALFDFVVSRQPAGTVGLSFRMLDDLVLRKMVTTRFAELVATHHLKR